ncbi:DUF2842 domain-containing protein [Muricoccus radiodurans]|uniref:DUF2842 domain-containing protein n=1 Tax=Muricoccus radiodurans TaxID=2231721 RepID=UPI003CE9066C
MSRIPVAVVGGLLGMALYIGFVVALADFVLHRHWAVQVAYFAVAGFAWTFPVRRLMYWAAGMSPR